MTLRHAIGAVRADNGEIRHPHGFYRSLFDQSHALDAALVARKARPYLRDKTSIDFVDNVKVARHRQFEQFHRPAVERFRQQRMVGVGKCPDRQLPRLIPAKSGVIEQSAHEFRDSHRRVRIVELYGDAIRKLRPLAAFAAEAPHDVGQRAGYEEILLQKPQMAADGPRIVGIENPGESFRQDFLVNGAENVSLIALVEIEVIR